MNRDEADRQALLSLQHSLTNMTNVATVPKIISEVAEEDNMENRSNDLSSNDRAYRKNSSALEGSQKERSKDRSKERSNS